MMNMYDGFLIAIEGINGSGKSTLAESLKKELELKSSDNIVILKEPYNSSIYDKIDFMTQSEAIATFMADRIEYRKELIKRLINGDTVILDRFYWSTAVFQSDDLYYTREYLINLGKSVQYGLEPDIIFYIDISPSKAYERISKLCSDTGTAPDINESLDKLYVFKSKYDALVREYRIEHNTDYDNLHVLSNYNLDNISFIKDIIHQAKNNKARNKYMMYERDNNNE